MGDPRVAEVLQAARDLIATPERWTQGTSARNAAGVPVSPVSAEAACWCGAGALYRFVGRLHGPFFGAVVLVMQDFIEGEDINDWNNAPGRTHAEVLAAFDRAVAAMRGDEPDAVGGLRISKATIVCETCGSDGRGGGPEDAGECEECGGSGGKSCDVCNDTAIATWAGHGRTFLLCQRAHDEWLGWSAA